MEELQKKCEPNTGAAKVQLKQDFHSLKPETVDKDPDVWFTQLELKRYRRKTLGAINEDDDFTIHILNQLPREYKTVVELCKEELSRGNSNITTVKERIWARFTRLQKANKDQDEAVALMARSQFKGACTVCGKIGHIGVDRFTLEKNKAKKEAFYKKVGENWYKNNKNNKSNKGRWRPSNRGTQHRNARADDPSRTVYNKEMVLVA